ncbi:Card1-like endonuclease domain-containing protein, partial [Parabacteroides sp.]
IKKYVNPQDIKLGVLIKRTENTNQNDLDVVFISGNKLFVVECKTGILGEKMFNETVYKATAIKETVLGLSANTFIVSLATEDEKLKKTAKNMGIQYKCREDIENPQLFENFIMQIKKTARD